LTVFTVLKPAHDGLNTGERNTLPAGPDFAREVIHHVGAAFVCFFVLAGDVHAVARRTNFPEALVSLTSAANRLLLFQ
jgi:hypothetical protein